MRESIRFVLDGQVVSLKCVDPTRTVLQYLREDLRRTGSKEGCAEGDCGACTVVVADLNARGDGLRYRAVNACIRFLPTLDGKELLTVESLAPTNGELHPVQQAMVDCHGSQCGFCTPGFVMSLFALYKAQQKPARIDIDNALSGNLCRCTGYRPIVDAAVKMYAIGDRIPERNRSRLNAPCNADTPARSSERDKASVDLLQSIIPKDTLHLAFEGRQYFAPHSLASLAACMEQHPDACLLAGGTDVGLWVTKQHRSLATVIYLGNVAELTTCDVTATHIEIGAAVSFSDALPVLNNSYPELAELWLRFASPPIRNAGTLCGNIANGSPIGDSMPALIALGASLGLRNGSRSRELPLDAFYLDYQVTALEAGEFVERVRIPLPRPGLIVNSYKLSKRFDQDISAVCGAYALELEKGTVRNIRIAYGGLAATVRRAVRCEQQLAGKPWNETTVQSAMATLDGEFTPLSDMRASQQYRTTAARNLLYRFYLESTGYQAATNVYSYGR